MTRGAGCCYHCVMRSHGFAQGYKFPAQGSGWEFNLGLSNSRAQVLSYHITPLFSLFCLVSLVLNLLDGKEATQLLCVSHFNNTPSHIPPEKDSKLCHSKKAYEDVHFSELILRNYYYTFQIQSMDSKPQRTQMRALSTFFYEVVLQFQAPGIRQTKNAWGYMQW